MEQHAQMAEDEMVANASEESYDKKATAEAANSKKQKLPLKKQLLNHPIIHIILCRFVWFYCWVVYSTCRIEKVIDSAALPYVLGEKQAIFALWHGRLLLSPIFTPSSRPAYALISAHRDGKILSIFMKYMKVVTIEGSSSKGSLGAVKKILKVLKEGSNVVITPDGPRGPNQQAAQGVAVIPAKSGVPIVPVAYATSWNIRLKSWDTFMIPLPFSRLVFTASAPIMVEKKQDAASAEAVRLQMEKKITDVTNLADKLAS